MVFVEFKHLRVLVLLNGLLYVLFKSLDQFKGGDDDQIYNMERQKTYP